MNLMVKFCLANNPGRNNGMTCDRACGVAGTAVAAPNAVPLRTINDAGCPAITRRRLAHCAVGLEHGGARAFTITRAQSRSFALTRNASLIGSICAGRVTVLPTSPREMSGAGALSSNQAARSPQRRPDPRALGEPLRRLLPAGLRAADRSRFGLCRLSRHLAVDRFSGPAGLSFERWRIRIRPLQVPYRGRAACDRAPRLDRGCPAKRGASRTRRSSR